MDLEINFKKRPLWSFFISKRSDFNRKFIESEILSSYNYIRGIVNDS